MIPVTWERVFWGCPDFEPMEHNGNQWFWWIPFQVKWFEPGVKTVSLSMIWRFYYFYCWNAMAKLKLLSRHLCRVFVIAGPRSGNIKTAQKQNVSGRSTWAMNIMNCFFPTFPNAEHHFSVIRWSALWFGESHSTPGPPGKLLQPSPHLQLHGEAFLEEGIRVPSAAAETDHGILLVGLVLLATNQALVPACGQVIDVVMALGDFPIKTY